MSDLDYLRSKVKRNFDSDEDDEDKDDSDESEEEESDAGSKSAGKRPRMAGAGSSSSVDDEDGAAGLARAHEHVAARQDMRAQRGGDPRAQIRVEVLEELHRRDQAARDRRQIGRAHV